MQETVSIKDVYSQLATMKGQMQAIADIVPKVSENERNIIRLQESDKVQNEQLKGIVESIKEGQKQNQRILIAIGIIAVLGGVFGQEILKKLFA